MTVSKWRRKGKEKEVQEEDDDKEEEKEQVAHHSASTTGAACNSSTNLPNRSSGSARRTARVELGTSTLSSL